MSPYIQTEKWRKTGRMQKANYTRNTQ